jgi:DNA mismatch endonuclease (patch repair protein)
MSVGASLYDMDRYTKADRSRIMSRVRARDTQPEIIVRSTLHKMGFRFRLHRSDLPGKPDIVLPKLRKVIFVHGCFWHQHQGCSKAKRPHTNLEFWNAKLDRNVARDLENYADLTSQSWASFVIWECETRQTDRLIQRLRGFLGGAATPSD